MRALLDVNVLIALLDTAHVHHLTAFGMARTQPPLWLSLLPSHAERLHSHHGLTGLPEQFTAREVVARLAEAMATPITPSGGQT